MSQLRTDNPIALQALMSETIFMHGMDAGPVASSVGEVLEERQNKPSEEFIYQGNKSTGVLFILRYPDYPYFSPAAEDAFVKTLGALGLSLDNVAVVNLANTHNPNDFKRIMQFFEPTKITLLGVE